MQPACVRTPTDWIQMLGPNFRDGAAALTALKSNAETTATIVASVVASTSAMALARVMAASPWAEAYVLKLTTIGRSSNPATGRKMFNLPSGTYRHFAHGQRERLHHDQRRHFANCNLHQSERCVQSCNLKSNCLNQRILNLVRHYLQCCMRLQYCNPIDCGARYFRC